MSLKRTVLISVATFSIFSLYLLVQHEYHTHHAIAPSDRNDFLIMRNQMFDQTRGDGLNSSQSTEKVKFITLSSVVELDTSVNTLRLGDLFCNGQSTISEVVYWKKIPGDISFESPLTPHHGEHHEKFITFEYDHGGWNNIRMGLECLIVVAHAMGRTLVIPPQHHLYLLHRNHPNDKGEMKDEMGFEDFFDINLLKSHQGLHTISTKEYLQENGAPNNNSNAWGKELVEFLRGKATEQPQWAGRYVSFLSADSRNAELGNETKARLELFAGDRSPVYYDEALQKAPLIHFQGGDNHRLLQHFYAFAFFPDPKMQTFYKRLIRDFMRYKDPIQCAGAAVLVELRKDALRHNNGTNADFYAIHARRGDFQFKEVKLSAADIVKNIQAENNGVSIIPRGALVYLSTDDPKGLCENCLVQRIACTQYEPGKKPPGCPEDTTWNAFKDAGWTVRMLDDYVRRGTLEGVNPNVFGMVESIVCSRAKAFVGTFFSTYTGYIHRLRGYHGLGEESYYHSTGKVMALRSHKSIGHGWSREWRAGWTDEQGNAV